MFSEVVEDLKVALDRRSMDLGEAMDALRSALIEDLGVQRATLYLLDPVSGDLVSRSVSLPKINAIRLGPGEGVAGRVAREGLPLRKAVADPRSAAAVRMDETTGFFTSTVLCVPLELNGRVVGALQVLNKSEGDFDGRDEAQLIDAAERTVDLLAGTSLMAQISPGASQPLALGYNGIVGASTAISRLYELLRRAARTDITVLLRGETGTGKTLAAHALHDNSARRDGPFVVVDCAAIPEHLLENELFGHAKGAYTGAVSASGGLVAAAEGGTLFLDEVGELGLPAQAKLLRLVQDRTYYSVGGTQLRHADVRFVCATHVDLAARVEARQFRRDLFYRLRVVDLELPTLKDRGSEDLDRLIDHFLWQYSERHGLGAKSFTPTARARLHAYAWPGNVRELQHVIEAAVVLSDGLSLGVEDLRLPDALQVQADDGRFTVEHVVGLRELNARYARWALARCGDNRSATASALGIGRNTLAGHLSRTDVLTD